MIRIKFAKKETCEEHTQLGEALKEFVTERGTDALRSVDDAASSLREKNIPESTVLQISLFLKASNISNYYEQAKNGISMIDVNNIVTCACEETGLTKKSVKYLLTAVLYAIGVSTDIHTVVIPTEGDATEADKSILSEENYAEKLTAVQNAVKNKDEKQISALSADFNELVNAGIPEALYLKGMCCMNGIATEPNTETAYKYLAAASNAGHAEAAAVLGDYYYLSKTRCNYTKAYEYYTQLGAVALSDERKNNLKAITATEEQNVKQLALSGMLLIALIIFNAKIGAGFFDAAAKTHWALTVISDVLLCLIYGASIFRFTMLKYNKTKWVAVAMTAVFSAFAFIAFV